MVEYEMSKNGKRIIYCSHRDTEIASLWVEMECPYCRHLQQELDLTDCGTTYQIECDSCEKEYEMYFDAD